MNSRGGGNVNYSGISVQNIVENPAPDFIPENDWRFTYSVILHTINLPYQDQDKQRSDDKLKNDLYVDFSNESGDANCDQQRKPGSC